MLHSLPTIFDQLASAEHRIVAYQGSWPDLQALSAAELRTMVQHWYAVIEPLSSNNIAIYQRHGVQLAAAILACWRLGKTAVIPASNRPGLLRSWPSLQQQCAELAADSDFVLPMSETLPSPEQASALVIFTSGSSGTPTAVAKSFAQLDAELASLEQQWASQVDGSVFISSVSRQHMYGLPFSLLWPLARGSAFCSETMHFLEPLEALAKQHAFTLITSPAQLQHLPSQLNWSLVQTQTKQVFCAGAPLQAADAINATQLFGREVSEIYGCTEAGAIAWRQQQQSADWQPLAGNELQTTVTATNEKPRLQLRSAATANPSTWLTLDDAATMTENGHFQLNGRVDRIVKVGSKRISLTAIENALIESSLVASAKALQLHERKSRIGVVVVLSATGKAMLIDQGKAALNELLRDWLKPKLEPLALPRYWRYITAMPIDSQGKTSTAQLHNFFFEEQQPRMAELLNTQRDGNHVSMQLLVPIDLYYFNGHFPGDGVLPGVVQVDWAIHYIRQAFPELQTLTQQFQRLENIKFQHMIRPNSQIELILEAQPERQRVLFSYQSKQAAATAKHSSGRIVFATSPETSE